MQPISLMNLYEIGTHRGNSKSKLNPRLRKSVHSFNNGLCVINLVDTISSLENVAQFFHKLGQRRKQILIVGTSKHIQNHVPKISEGFQGGAMPFVNNRWLGGTLTNWSTIRKTLKTLEKLENIQNNKEFFNTLARNEQLNIQRKYNKIFRFFGGLRTLKNNRPGAVIVMDGFNNPMAIKEAESNRIPCVVLTNTNVVTLPKNLDNTIVCNNNSLKTVEFISDYLVQAYNEGIAAGVLAPKEEQTEKQA